MQNQYRLQSNNALTLCLTDTIENGFTHPTNGTDFGPASGKCQKLAALVCASDWNSICEFMAANTRLNIPNEVYPYACTDIAPQLTVGDMVIRNTASYKYAYKPLGLACYMDTEPFNPLDSYTPQVTVWTDAATGQACPRSFTIYDFRALDEDPVMNHLLDKPYIGFDILMSIQATLIAENKLHLIQGTKLEKFYRFVSARRAQLQAGML